VELAAGAAEGLDDLVVGAQSMGAFTAFPLCERVSVQRLVLLNAMIPLPGERATDWWGNTGSEEARLAAARAGGYSEQLDLATYFLHDVPPEVAAGSEKHQKDEAEAAFVEPCPFDAYPEIPITVLSGEDDRFFPFEFQSRVATERLGVQAKRLPGSHLNAVSQPDAVTEALLAEQ
jgi:pimeloyl-ACP methyl ester carboxylesterase